MKEGENFYVTTKERQGFIVIEVRDAKTSSIKKTYTNSGKIIVPPSVSGLNLFYTYKNGVVTKSVNINLKTNKKTERIVS
tara:strand:+ start:8266 stop:8505 length:240 start_codon:yes stop_codon:yes gene_type:complete